MCAHAAFNGTLVVLAVLVAVGPGHVFESHGVSVRAPGGWQKVELVETVRNPDLALEGPGGAIFVVHHDLLPPNIGLDLQDIANGVNGSAFPSPQGSTITPNSARVVTYPAGQAVEFSAVSDGHADEVLLLPSGGQLWEIDVLTAGSRRAKGDYPGMLQSLQLPTAVTS